MQPIRDMVIQGYSHDWVINRYSKVGLWPSEAKLFRQYFPPKARVLDIGCGAGRTTVPLAQMGYKVLGIDLSPAMIERARAVSAGMGARYEVMDASQLQLQDGSFDAAVFSYNGIELLPGKEGKRQAIREVHRVLRPGGVFIFTSHSLYALNQYAGFRARNLMRFCLAKAVGRRIPEREIGEAFYAGEDLEVYYMQILPPGFFLRTLRRAGFELLLHNSRGRIEQGKGPWPFTSFEDRERFYVARKRSPSPSQVRFGRRPGPLIG